MRIGNMAGLTDMALGRRNSIRLRFGLKIVYLLYIFT